MKLYTSATFSDEDGEAVSAKSAIVYGTKKEILELAEFFSALSKHLKKSDSCHMHFSEFSKNWKKRNGIDIEVNIK
jgi:hypothetical protein